ELAIKAALKAGEEILDVYYNSDFGIEYKADNSPLTIADQRAHNAIMNFLSPTKIPILSEEGKTIAYTERKKWKLFWLVDPLDGTKEFVKRNDEFTVNIALIEGNTPIAGVVYVPVTKTLYWSNENGSFKGTAENGNEAFSDIQQLPLNLNREKFVIAGSKSHMNEETEKYIQQLDTKGKTVEMKSKGSSLKICMVAEGNADVYPRLAPTMEWDTAAGHSVVKFAGKEIIQFESKDPLIYNKENLLNPWFVVQ
ncbi:MAG TPA: 3'(2'),5'-bisphosphate nucleotidase CysQ, partial [Draconibacterium sp.]|nr:3'(2'),5'-bisphosphate nucleotidase CysQ [Draconibacterium sp.]